MIYLASPYSDPDPAVIEQRFLDVEFHTAKFLKRSHVIYSPIVHCHEMAKRHDLPKHAEFWRWYNEGMLDIADELWILMLPGYDKSLGVRQERDYALTIPLLIRMVVPWSE